MFAEKHKLLRGIDNIPYHMFKVEYNVALYYLREETVTVSFVGVTTQLKTIQNEGTFYNQQSSIKLYFPDHNK